MENIYISNYKERIKAAFSHKGMLFNLSLIKLSDNSTDCVIFRINEKGEQSDDYSYTTRDTKFTDKSIIETIETFCNLVDKGELNIDFVKYEPQQNLITGSDNDIDIDDYPNEEIIPDEHDYKYEGNKTIYESVIGLIEYGNRYSKIAWAELNDNQEHKTIYVLIKDHSDKDIEKFLDFLKINNRYNEFGSYRYVGNIVFENGDYITTNFYYNEGVEDCRWEYFTIPKYKYKEFNRSGYINDL